MASRRPLKALRVLVIVAGVALMALLGLLWWEHGTEIALPTPTGRFAVGRASCVWATGGQAGDVGPSHELRDQRVVWIWYPAAPAPGSRPSEYLPAP